ncbi:class I adenylate cyclase [Actinobacillus equuli subsp. haemolyticus]|uniref:class I adenylate cyclase n=1 Tax=Actinobacillus equuli TaxID=718 RepID=UPI0024427165|nr:class I adenylate cyclase [Actinobacillus equuli]WGE42449.1 class I adenylate cyclase [Actinobacillus equuli subsp. haemolyticus]WGE67631.1 class I adenylate cyclase [Actinobacillus equuli subsp. haemolyticus]
MEELELSTAYLHQPLSGVSDTFSSIANQLSWSIPRIDALNDFRIKRALAANNPQFQYVFSLLPLLIHANCPELPAYVKNAPSGIAQFQLSDFQNRYLASVNLSAETIECFSQNPAFDALYSMGSTGSITQTSLSDLDLWLCYSDRLSAVEYQLIEQKLTKIKHWAKHFEVELNFYLMNPNHFKANLTSNDVNTEHSGSAQHFFLLDEFYRSAIRLSGKRLLWLHLSDKQYQKCMGLADFDQSEWIDFGDFSSLSTAEFFGASLWQLYKGIDCPYKSALKILLLESYAETYPETALISKVFKQKLLNQTPEKYHFDPYLAMLEQVTVYLTNRKEFVRLGHVRMCFYMKANEGDKSDSWRKQALLELVHGWQWNVNEIKLLDNRESWKIKQAISHQQIIVDLLLQSYRNLIHFARKFHIDPSILTNDIDTLMRKLYSVFEVLPGKIQLINPHIAKNLSESAVTFIEAREGSTLQSGWYLINQAPRSPYNSELRYVRHAKNLIKVVAWGYFNGVVTSSTQLHLISRSLDLPKLRQFITDLRLSFPVTAPMLSEQDMLHPNEIRSLILAVNLVNDPTQKLADMRRSVQPSDLFNFGSSQENLVGSVSIIYRNMWNEIRTLHFEGDDAILKALKLISNKIYRGSAPPQSVNVFCYSRRFRSELREFIADLVHRCITIQTGTISHRHSLNTLKVAGKTWQFIFGKQKVAIQQIEDQAVDFTQNFANSALNPESNGLTFPREIDEFASEGFLQFFFEDNPDESFNVYILDEKNMLEAYYYCFGSKEEKVKEINRLHSVEENAALATSSFNFPQFYQLIRVNGEMQIVPFQSKQHRDYLAQLQAV